MARVTFSQSNFSGGEISPIMRGRFDLEIYYKSVSYMRNFFAQTQGPASFRGGTVFASITRNNKKARLVRFQYNVLQAYVLELTDNFMRIYKDGGLITDTALAITGITKANPAVVTSASHGLSNGQQVYIDGVVGMDEINVLGPYTVAGVTTNTFQLSGVDSTAFSTYVSGGTIRRIVEVATPWSGTQIDQLQYAQTYDTMYAVHQGVAPRKITRSSHTSWSVATYSRTSDPFASATNYPGTVTFFEQRLVYGGTITKPQTLFFSKSNSYDDMTVGTAAADGMQYTIASEEVNAIQFLVAGQKYLTVGTYGGPFKVQGDDDAALTPNNIRITPSANFGCEQQMPVRIDNVILFTQRGGLTMRTLTQDVLSDTFKAIDANLVADHITESGIGGLSLQTGRPDIIWAWLNNGRMIGLNYKQDEAVQGWFQYDTQGKFVSNCNISQVSGGDQHWVCVNRTINGTDKYFVEYFKNQPVLPRREDWYFTPGTTPAEKTEQSSLEQAAYDWQLYESQKNVYHVDAGLSASGLQSGVTLTFSAVTGTGVTVTASGSFFLPGDVGNQIWNYGANGRAEITGYTSATQVTVDILRDFDDLTPLTMWYLTFNEVIGLQHLNGMTVRICADGGTHPDKVVENGRVTLDQQVSVAHIGLGYNGLVVTNNLESGGNNGPAQTKPRNIAQLGIQFLQTLGCRVGTSFYRMEQVKFYDTKSITGRPPALYTGSKKITIDDNWEEDKFLYVFQDMPLPCNVLSIIPYMTTNDT